MRTLLSSLLLIALSCTRTSAEAQVLADPASASFSLREIPTRELVRADLLARSLAELARDDADRKWRGWLLVGAGAAVGAAAGVVKEPELRGLLALSSAVTLGHGITQLSIATGAREAVASMERQPVQDVRGWREQLALGERGLARVARQSRRVRIVEGSLTVFGAVAFVPLSWGLSRIDDPHYRFGSQAFDYVGLTLSIIACASGLVQTFLPSPAERIHERYLELPR